MATKTPYRARGVWAPAFVCVVFGLSAAATGCADETVELGRSVTRAEAADSDTTVVPTVCPGWEKTLELATLVGGGTVAETALMDIVAEPNGASWTVGWFAHGSGLTGVALHRDGAGKLVNAVVAGKDDKQIVKFHAATRRKGGGIWVVGSRVHPGTSRIPPGKRPSPMLGRIVGKTFEVLPIANDLFGELNAITTKADMLLTAGSAASVDALTEAVRIDLTAVAKPSLTLVHLLGSPDSDELGNVAAQSADARFVAINSTTKGQVGELVFDDKPKLIANFHGGHAITGQLRALHVLADGRPVGVGWVKADNGTAGVIVVNSADLEKQTVAVLPARSKTDRLEAFAVGAKGQIHAVGATRSLDGKHREGWFTRIDPVKPTKPVTHRYIGGGLHAGLRSIASAGKGRFIIGGFRKGTNGSALAWQANVDGDGRVCP